MRRWLRGLGALIALAGVLVGAPLLLLAWGRLRLWTWEPGFDDGSLLLAVLTTAGWLAWAAFTGTTILEAIRRESGHAARSIRGEEIARRLVLRMVNEAFFILEEGIAQRESDLDVAVVLGLRFPDFRGGVLKYAKDLGLGAVYDELQKLAAQCGERFSPCERLRTMKGTD